MKKQQSGLRFVAPAELSISTAASTWAAGVAILTSAAFAEQRSMTLELGAVDEIDTAGVQLIIALRARASEVGGTVELVDVTPQCARVFALAGFDTDFLPTAE